MKSCCRSRKYNFLNNHTKVSRLWINVCHKEEIQMKNSKPLILASCQREGVSGDELNLLQATISGEKENI